MIASKVKKFFSDLIVADPQSGKPQITEEMASMIFLRTTLDDVQDYWPKLYEELKIHNLPISKDDSVQEAFFIAYLSLELQALPNLFPEDQADKIFKIILDYFSPDSPTAHGKRIIQNIEMYDSAFKQSVREGRENPLLVIPALLLSQWVGDDIESFCVDVMGKKVISPTIVIHLADIFSSNAGYWKRLKDKYELVR